MAGNVISCSRVPITITAARRNCRARPGDLQITKDLKVSATAVDSILCVRPEPPAQPYQQQCQTTIRAIRSPYNPSNQQRRSVRLKLTIEPKENYYANCNSKCRLLRGSPM